MAVGDVAGLHGFRSVRQGPGELDKAPRPPTTVPTSPDESVLKALFALSSDVEALQALQRHASRRRFVDGQCIYMQDDDVEFLHIVVSGHVRLSYIMADGSSVLHDIVPMGGTFGELGVFDRSTHADMAVAMGAVVILSIASRYLSSAIESNPALDVALKQAVSQRYRGYIAVIRDLSLPSLSARLAGVLLRLADRLDTRSEHEGRAVQIIGPMVTQTDLGAMARGSRGNVNRILQAWQRSGRVALRERSILILDRRALAAESSAG